jgi:hypothetical protein
MASPTLDETIAELKLAGQRHAVKTASETPVAELRGSALLRKVASALRESKGERLTWDDFHGVKTASSAPPRSVSHGDPLREAAAELRKYAAEQAAHASVKTAHVLAGFNALTLLENGLTR